ncbi:DUF493 domain-containing protein [Paucidesulfovibrio longus]|uniref:DUF493 domain-containing protein n=1 Tax=Paucidesulfovibrio longus TaxID=889 RepID=UPI0003B4E005|nr:DUF493 domain-containing protein [Paucidesulfovibrio longus]
MTHEKYESLRRTLNECHEWPCNFVFKFIGTRDNAEQAAALFPDEAVSLRPSRTGKYIGVTAEITVASAEDVFEIYAKAKLIEGLICL